MGVYQQTNNIIFTFDVALSPVQRSRYGALQNAHCTRFFVRDHVVIRVRVYSKQRCQSCSS